ncbi:MAG: PepSY domain-containing protein, partial [Reinekea forsetii]|nr:PepSY domain-containing protein [Reinekea forsetii]
MLRTFHSVAAWLAALLVLVLALTGVVLAASPLIDRAQARVSGTSALSIAEVVGRIVEHYPSAEQIERTPSGSLIVYFSAAQNSVADRVDPITGQAIAPYQLSPVMVWVKSLHRSLLLATPGRVVSATAALLMLLLSLSGIVLLLRRLGGWRRLLGPVQGSLGSRIHAELGRFAVLGLILSATTGLYMSATTLGLLPEYQQTDPLFPDSVSIGTPAPVGQLLALQDLPIGALRDLVFPYPDDPADVFSLRTRDGLGFVDQNSGELLSFQSFGPLQRVYEFIYMLHTGEGL